MEHAPFKFMPMRGLDPCLIEDTAFTGSSDIGPLGNGFLSDSVQPRKLIVRSTNGSSSSHCAPPPI